MAKTYEITNLGKYVKNTQNYVDTLDMVEGV